jgi:hypothetical protein
VPRPELECVDALKRSQPRGGHCASLAQVEILRHAGHVPSVRGGELGVKATLPVAELVGVDAVADAKAADAGALGDDNAAPSTPGTSRPRLRHRNLVQRQYRRGAESIDGRRFHRAGNHRSHVSLAAPPHAHRIVVGG